MTGRLAILGGPVALVALYGCAGLTGGSYGLESGDANYDALRAATATCQARGGAVRLRKGFDGRELSNYECVIGGKR